MKTLKLQLVTVGLDDGKQGIFIGENAVQLHGGMGMTEELRIGHYFKRLLVIDAQFGNADHHLTRFAA